MEVLKYSRLSNKRAGCNKAIQVGMFQISIVKKSSLLEIFQKLIHAGGNKGVQVGIFQKSIVKNHKEWMNFRN